MPVPVHEDARFELLPPPLLNELKIDAEVGLATVLDVPDIDRLPLDM